jgi:hypothetical protein
VSNVRELPAGRYDAVRTLRHLLAQAERGDFNHVVVICNKRGESPSSDDEIWACWSDMDATHVWWAASWLVSFLRRRYFSGEGLKR